MSIKRIDFGGRILVIGLGSVSRLTLPLLQKHINMPMDRITVMDFDDPLGEKMNIAKSLGMNFVNDRVTPDNLSTLLGKYTSNGDAIVDLAWNIKCSELLQWCHDANVKYLNTSVEEWDPYYHAEDQSPVARSLYWRQMQIRKMMKNWKKKGATAVLDHGANPGFVSHLTKQALLDISGKWLEDFKEKNERRAQIEAAREKEAFNLLAHHLGVKVIHISERDSQITNKPKRFDEFCNTWSIDGLYEEGIAPSELGWGTHERTLPEFAHAHQTGPLHQICLATEGWNTWVRTFVPSGETLGMVIRHGEAFSIPEHLTVKNEHGETIYRPTVHYAYCPSDSAIASLHELEMRNFKIQSQLRILGDDIIDGKDELGVLLMGHDYKSWWLGSLLDIHEARRLLPVKDVTATTLQVSSSVLSGVMWMIENPNEGVRVPDDLPHRYAMEITKPYWGPMISQAFDWTPLKNRFNGFGKFGGVQRPREEDLWQFNSFLVRNK
mmetsp:Transcript_24599/g.28664  ORF Transcript_24599/g.28664 Transcript_24599/m.28664 type:complete len:494 (-) Transcript_24599:196-1677(-)